ncbi:MAG: hypothetical protein GXC76_14275 [Rhodanobacteraceae bacterium]|jgi:hypothetical protein|nr:hypothetical protein [Rhodanobacteraceae bacterium]
MRRTQGVVASSSLALVIAAGSVTATPALDYTIGVSLRHDDNVNQSATDPVSDNILTPSLAFSLNQQGSAVTARAAGTLEYRDYMSGSYNSQFAGLLSGTAAWHISPERLDWVVEDYVGRQPVDVLANNTPSNQQQTNVFSTGPTLRAHFGDGLRGQLDLRYTNNYAEVSKDFNGDRISAAGRVLYLLDPTSELAGNLSVESARFDVAPKRFDYDRGDAYLGYSRSGGSVNLQGSLGYSRLTFRDGGGSHGGLLATLTVTYAPNPANTFALGASDTYSDAAAELSLDPSQIGQQGVVGSGLSGVVVAPDVYRERSLRLSFGHHGERYHLTVAPFVRRLHYLDPTTPDERSRGLYADFTWSLTARNELSVFAGGENRDYVSLDRNDRDRSYGASVSWQQARNWAWVLSVTRLKRSTNALDQSFTENAIGLSLIYRR